MAHSPTPWSITDKHGEYIIRSADDEWLSNKSGYDHSAFDRKDAEFIVRAVNAHDDLVKALEATLAVHGEGYSWCPAARAALSKAKAAQS